MNGLPGHGAAVREQGVNSLNHDAEIERLIALGPEAQGDIDDTLLQDNLHLSLLERLEAASRAAQGVETIRAAMRRALHDRRIRELPDRPDAPR